MKEQLNSAGIFHFGLTALPHRGSWFDVRAAQRVPHNAKTAIVCLFPYYIKCEKRNTAMVAAVNDYHIVAKQMMENAIQELKPKYPGDYAAFIDNSPFDEISLAVFAELGSRGRNGLLITEQFGSWVFIGEIVTNAKKLETQKKPVVEKSENNGLKGKTGEGSAEFCTRCDRCIEACPAGILPEKSKRTCISAITQKKGELSEQERAMIKLGGSAWGCDICQDACPCNFNVKQTQIPMFLENFAPVITDGALEVWCKTKLYA
ncbi:MAG: DUF1730 domain-containing protein, partial [Oscillospiraceae bacterium]|nr:DUF1730 domain-containing protein [Oscillospiraceae bacterium]